MLVIPIETVCINACISYLISFKKISVPKSKRLLLVLSEFVREFSRNIENAVLKL